MQQLTYEFMWFIAMNETAQSLFGHEWYRIKSYWAWVKVNSAYWRFVGIDSFLMVNNKEKEDKDEFDFGSGRKIEISLDIELCPH